MSFLENDLMVDAAMELLNDTITMQEEQLEVMEERISILSCNHRKELERISREHSKILDLQAVSYCESLGRIENEKESKFHQCHEQIKTLKAVLESSKAEILSLIKSSEEKSFKLASFQSELHLKDQAICQQFQEISELKKKLEAEQTSTRQLEAACLELKILLNRKSRELEESLEDVNESYKLIESIQSTSENNEAKLIQNMLQLKEKIEQTCGAAIEFEASNKELNCENKNLNNLVGELMEDVEALQDSKEQLTAKVNELENAQIDLALTVQQKEQSIAVLITDSAKAVDAINQLLTENANKDDSFCKLYGKYLEESREKEILIRGLKAALADNAKETSVLRSELNEIFRNCI